MYDLPEPLISGPNQARKVTLHVLDVVELGCQRVVNIDDDDFPVGLTLVEQSHDTQNLDLLHLADEAYSLTDLTDIQRVVVALSFCLGVESSRVLPSLTIINDAQASE